MTITAQKRAVGYARVSTDQQVGFHHASLDTQEKRIIDHSVGFNYSLVQTFVDVQSGRRDDRPDYQRMLAFVRDDGADVVVVQYLDRFGRNPEEILGRFWELKRLGVTIDVTDEDIQEEFVLLMRAGIAGAESKRTSERVKANMARIVSRGTHSGRTPFGFKPARRFDGSRAIVDHWEIDAPQAEVIREMVRLATEDNRGFLSIANTLNEKGYRTASGGTWVAASVHVILRNPVLNGTMVYGRRGKKKGNVDEEKNLIRVENAFPKILSDQDWVALQKRLDIRREHSRGATHKSDYVLSGIARCGHCGGPMTGKMTSTYKGKKYAKYYCSRAQHSREACAFYNGHAAPKLEAAVLEYLAQYSDTKKVRELLDADGRREIKKREAELRRIGKQLTAIEADFDKNLDLLKRDILNDDEFTKANEARRQERSQLEARQVGLASKLRAQAERHDAVTALPAQIRSFLKDFQSLEVRKAKALLQTILASAHVYKDGRIELAFR